MSSNTAKKLKTKETAVKSLTIEEIHASFQTDFEEIKDRLDLTEQHLHSDSTRVDRHVVDIIEEERDQKKNIMAMMGVLILLNIVTAIAAIVVVTGLILQQP